MGSVHSVDATASSCIVPYNSFCLIDYALDNAFSVTVHCIFFCIFTFNQPMFLNIKTLLVHSTELYTAFSFDSFDQFRLLIGVFKLLTCHVMTDKVGFTSAVFVCFISHFLIPAPLLFPSFVLNRYF